ncbi:MAG TPA: trypsin-like peptidase domain-containing protein, partial [Ilumatobacteraceae bacterium]|nr:trypsin-like peptidase domain-containing protein [Ilumatobacteraceae bacterium]
MTSCGSSGEGHEEADDSVVTGDDPLAAAVRIEAFGCHTTATVGGGSFVGPERVLTVAHVVAGAEHIEVELADGRMAEAQVVAIDRDLDLAVLHVEVNVPP